MRAIWKYELSTVTVQDIDMPAGARVLFIRTQYGTPRLWAEVDSSAPTVRRRFATYGTGHPVRTGIYVGSYTLDGDTFVGHVYEEKI